MHLINNDGHLEGETARRAARRGRAGLLFLGTVQLLTASSLAPSEKGAGQLRVSSANRQKHGNASRP